MFGFLYFISIPIIFGGGGGAIKKMAEGAFTQLSYLTGVVNAVFIIVVASVIALFILKVYNYFFVRTRFKKAKILLHQFHTELVLLNSLSKFDDNKKLDIKLTKEETVKKLIIFFKRPVIIKKIGLHYSQRVLDGLDLVDNKNLKLEDQLCLVNNWIKLLTIYL